MDAMGSWRRITGLVLIMPSKTITPSADILDEIIVEQMSWGPLVRTNAVYKTRDCNEDGSVQAFTELAPALSTDELGDPGTSHYVELSRRISANRQIPLTAKAIKKCDYLGSEPSEIIKR